MGSKAAALAKRWWQRGGVEARSNDSIQIANLTLEMEILIKFMSQGSLLRDGKNSMEFSFSVATSKRE